MEEGMMARSALDRLEDALVEDILNASDEDILAEIREDGGEDPAAIAAEVQAIFAAALNRTGL